MTMKKLTFKVSSQKDNSFVSLIKSVDKPKDYEDFWNEYNKGFTYCLKKYVNYNLKRRLRFIFKIIYYKSKKGKVE